MTTETTSLPETQSSSSASSANLAQETQALACEAKPQASLPKVTPAHRIEQASEEQGGSFQVLVELPGVAKGEVSLKLEKRVLTLQTERRFEQPAKARVHARGIADCRYELSLKLGEELDEERIEAKLENGLLRLTLPLSSEAQAREIALS